MAEAVHRAVRVTAITVTHGKVDPGGAQRQHRLPGIRHPHANRPRGVISAPRHDRHGWHVPLLCD